MNAIGGYFELELRKGEPFHQHAICLNSARNCFEYILRSRGYKRLFMPYFTCEVMFEAPRKLGLSIEYYSIDSNLEPVSLPLLKPDDAFVYTNYFGLKQGCVERLAHHFGSQLIVDNAQAFFAPNITNIDTFYSPRKYFGVPDGGYLYSNIDYPTMISQGVSWDRMRHLCRRIDQSASEGYQDFRDAECSISNSPIEGMSKLTSAILSGIDYDFTAQKRRENFAYLAHSLDNTNQIHFVLDDSSVPMVYPYVTDRIDLRSKLISKQIFIAKYWDAVHTWCHNLFENKLTEYLLPLPIDQRYSESDLDIIISSLLI